MSLFILGLILLTRSLTQGLDVLAFPYGMPYSVLSTPWQRSIPSLQVCSVVIPGFFPGCCCQLCKFWCYAQAVTTVQDCRVADSSCEMLSGGRKHGTSQSWSCIFRYSPHTVQAMTSVRSERTFWGSASCPTCSEGLGRHLCLAVPHAVRSGSEMFGLAIENSPELFSFKSPLSEI